MVDFDNCQRDIFKQCENNVFKLSQKKKFGLKNYMIKREMQILEKSKVAED